MADRQAKAFAFTSRFGREEWIEYLFLHVGRDTCAVIPRSLFDQLFCELLEMKRYLQP
jgi:hypothetical protein